MTVAGYVGRIVVVKLGGNAMGDEDLEQDFAKNVVQLREAGVLPVVVHGGGPQITEHLRQVGLTSEFVGGFRVTSAEAARVVRRVLVGEVQRDLVNRINRYGSIAIGLSGEDGRLLTARKMPVVVDGKSVDLGSVGEVVRVNAEPIHALLDKGFIPVVSSIGVGETGELFNLNADTAAGALAGALGAEKLVMLTDVSGLYADWPVNEQLIDRISYSDLQAMLPELSSGMLPKVEACLEAVKTGVPEAQIVGAGSENVVWRSLMEDQGFGTTVVTA